MADSPTIVIAHLDDSELKQAVQSLVSGVDAAVKGMANNFDAQITRMRESLKKLGADKIDFGGTTKDSGTSKTRTSETKADTTAIEENTNAKKRNAQATKEQAMTYDQILGALQMAQRQEKVYASKNPWSLTREESEKYAETIKRVAELQEKLNKKIAEMRYQSVPQYTPNIGAYSRSLSKPVGDTKEYKELVSHIKEMARTADRELRVSLQNAFKMPANSIEEIRSKWAQLSALLKQTEGTNVFTPQQVSKAKEMEASLWQQLTVEQKRTGEIHKQIDAIQSRANANRAFEKVTLMPSNTLDEKVKKLEAVTHLIEKLKGTGLISDKNLTLAYNIQHRLSDAIKSTDEQHEASVRRAATERVSAAQREAEIQREMDRVSRHMVEDFRARIINSHGEPARFLYNNEYIGYIYAENDARAQGLTIEQQMNRLIEESAKSRRQSASDAAQQTAAENDSLVAMRNRVKEIQKAYEQLGSKDRNSAKGQKLIDEFRELNREIKKAQSGLSNLNLANVLKFQPRTLEEMAVKMQQLQAIRQQLDVKGQASDIVTVNAALGNLQKEMDSVLQKSRRQASMNNALGRSWNYMKNRLAFYFTVGASTAFVKNLIEIRSQYEMTERALGILVQSAENGSRIFRELSQMALVSPYTLIELSNAAKQLTAYGVAAKDVVDITRRMGDIAAAVGVPMERLTYALGQIKAYGYLNSRDARMFLNAGIPLVQELASHYTKLEGRLVSVSDVYDRIKKKTVEYRDVMHVITEMTDESGRFFDYQAKVSDTLKVQLANLTLAWNNMLNAIGEDSQGFLTAGIGALKTLFLQWENIDRIIKEVIVGFGAFKAVQMFVRVLSGTTAKALSNEALAINRKKVAELEQIKITKELTAAEAEQLALTKKRIYSAKELTAADYQTVLAKKKLTAAQAMQLLTMNRGNKALADAMLQTGLLTKTQIKAATSTNALSFAFTRLGATLKSAGRAMKAFVRANWWMLLIGIVAEVGMSFRDNAKAVRDFNKAISESAKNAAKALEDFTKAETTINARKAAKENTLAPSEAKKTWELLKGEIERSSAASQDVIAELMKIPDLNQRIVKGFEFVDKIQSAQYALSNLDEETLKFTKNIAFGLGGQGLAKDAKQYLESLQSYYEIKNLLGDENKSTKSAFDVNEKQLEEFQGELDTTQKSLLDFMSLHGISSDEQIREVIKRFMEQLRAAEPDMSNDVADFIELELSKSFGVRDSALFDNYFKILKDNAGLFQGISEDWVYSGEKLDERQEKAIDKSKELLKQKFPQLAGIIEEQIEDWKKSDRFRIDIALRVGDYIESTPLQKEIARLIKDSGNGELFRGFEYLLPKSADDLSEYIGNLQTLWKNATDAKAQYLALGTAYGKEEAKRQEEIIKRVQIALDLLHQPYNKEGSKKNKSLDSALSEEVQLIGEIQKRYQENKKLGMSDIDARTKATDEYRKSLAAVNTVLKQYGLQTMSNDRLATMKPQEIREFYENQLHGISQTVQKIRTVTYDAAKEEMSEIDGISKKLVEQTKIFEGFRANSYYDENNVLTIGYGHSAKAPTIDKNPIVEGMTLTEEEAHRIMMEDYRVLKEQADAQITKFQHMYDSLRDMTASQYEALLDFTYQYGAGNLGKLLVYAEGDKEKIAEALGDTTVFGVKNWAQETRRAWRQAMFSGKEYTVTGTIRSQFEELTKESGKGIKALEKGIDEMGAAVNKEFYENIAKGLNNELGRLKDEYELAVELDANPELGNLFADIWGINVDELPKTVKEYAKRATTYLNRYLSDAGQGLQFGEGELFNLTASDMRAFEQMVQNNQLSQSAYDEIKKAYDFIRGNRLKDTKETMAEWNKLLEKYSEYEYKLGQIQKTAVRERLTFAKKNGTQEQQQAAVQLVTQIDAETDAEKKQELINQLKELVKEIAGKDGVKIQIVTAIDSQELEDSAQLSFEQFQKDPTWLTATGDLAGLTDSALGLLISRIEEYKKTAKNLTPKQIKQINNALKQLHQQVRKGNPFQVLSLAMKESKGRMDGYKKKIAELTEAEEDLYQQLEGESDSGKRTALSKQIQKVAEEIKKTKEEMEGVGETDFGAVLDFTNSLVQGASQVEGAFSSMFKAMGNTEFAETMDKVTNVLSQTASLAAAGFQMGGAWGAAIGGVIGLGTSLITNFAEQWSGNKGITEAIQESEKAVRSLEVAYKSLDVAINNAYGDQIIGAKRATVENKKLQLAELERQLQLEKSRKAKYRDDDKIISLQGQIIELKEEIANATKDIVNDLLGISSVGDAAENAVASMIEAFKNGEDYMKVFDETFEDMIDNMIVKAISAQVIGDRIQAVFDLVKQKSIERADNTLYEGIHTLLGRGTTFRENIEEYENLLQDAISHGNDALADMYQKSLNALLDEYNEVARIRPDDIKNLQDVISSLKEDAQDEFLSYMEAFGISFGQDSENDLSNLQQGLQSVSESTASAVEAYLNGMSQQAYLRNDLLTQIRDSILTFNFDAHLAVQSQMLLQMQSSYQEQQTIRSIMEGWSNANGMAVRVEMV